MALALACLLVAVLVGWASGGRLARLRALRLRGAGLLVAAVAVQVAATVLGGPAYPVGLVASAVLVGAFLTRNRGVRGTGLVAVGLLANAVVVAANAGMPVSLSAAGRAGVDVVPIVAGQDPRHVLAGPGTRLRPLGDVVPVALPLHPEVASPGDVLVAAGLAQLVVVGMRRRVWHPRGDTEDRESPMAKRGRKRRGRKKSAANHGNRPNA